MGKELLTLGNIVGFPTESVYGLGANAFDCSAIKRIFEIKKRPCDNPLIVHISSIDMLRSLYDDNQLPTHAYDLLIDEFWPGPITIILPKPTKIPFLVTANSDTGF